MNRWKIKLISECMKSQGGRNKESANAENERQEGRSERKMKELMMLHLGSGRRKKRKKENKNSPGEVSKRGGGKEEKGMRVERMEERTAGRFKNCGKIINTIGRREWEKLMPTSE